MAKDEAQFERAVTTLRSAYEGAKKHHEVSQILAARESVLAKWGPKFRQPQVDQLSIDDFQAFLTFQENHHWSSLRRTGAGIQDRQALIQCIKTLQDETQDLASRYDAAVSPIRGMGKAIATAIMHVAAPDRYGVLNSTSQEGLELLGLWPQRALKGGSKYALINPLLIELSRATGFDLWTLDAVFYYMVTTNPKQDETANQARNTWLITWNPSKFHWDSLSDAKARTLAGVSPTKDVGGQCWSVGGTKSIKTGDRLFLMRVGVEPRGIVGTAIATSDVYTAPHFSGDQGKEANYVDLKWEYLLNPEVDSVLALKTLEAEVSPHFRWTPQSSGINIPSETVTRLLDVWNKHLQGKHLSSTDSVREARAAIPAAVSQPDPAEESDLTYWIVGVTWSGLDDQLPRFLKEGIWQVGGDKFREEVLAIKPGDRLIAKSTFIRKNGLPFDNHGRGVSVMRIRATGIVVANHGDGRTVAVDWKVEEPPREWLFYTYIGTVSRLDKYKDMGQALIEFAFNKQPQAIQFFLADPYWAEKYALSEEVPPEPVSEFHESDILDDLIGGAPYSVENVVQDGCFLPIDEIERCLSRLRSKKNLILQGPPGTGKTWLARRLGYALIGRSNPKQIRALQFHPNLSYEDFVRGWRPTGDGRLSLVDGPLLEAVALANKFPDEPIIVLIEEINRGNPAQIFGEILTLIEADKRCPEQALELSYRRSEGERVFLPDNLHFIGTMNIADRSLALVDFALRRRFAFVNLEPRINEGWKSWVTDRCGITPDFADEVIRRMKALNETISNDPALGSSFAVGHSYVTPKDGLTADGQSSWFKEVVITEIGPLIEEYWFDAKSKADDAVKHLLNAL